MLSAGSDRQALLRTEYDTRLVTWLPAASVAVTLNEWTPGDVSIAVPLTTVPTHPFSGAMPEPPAGSVHVYDASTICANE